MRCSSGVWSLVLRCAASNGQTIANAFHAERKEVRDWGDSKTGQRYVRDMTGMGHNWLQMWPSEIPPARERAKTKTAVRDTQAIMHPSLGDEGGVAIRMYAACPSREECSEIWC